MHEILRCPCGGHRRVLAMVFSPVSGAEPPESIRRVLSSLGLPENPPARSPLRGVVVGLSF